MMYFLFKAGFIKIGLCGWLSLTGWLIGCAPTVAQGASATGADSLQQSVLKQKNSPLFPPVSVPPFANADVTSYLQESSQLHQQCRLNEAATALEAAIRLDPDNDFAYYRLAQVRSDQRRDEEALEAYRSAIRLNPDRLETYRGFRIVLDVHGMRDESIVAIQQTLRLAPDTPYASESLDRLLSSPTLAEQEAEMRDRIRREGSAFSYLALANWLLRQFRYEEAEALLTQVLQLGTDSRTASTYAYLAFALREQARYEEAETVSRQAITDGFDAGQVYAELGQTLYAQGELSEAAEALQKGATQTHTAQYYNALGNVLRDLGRFAESEAAYREAIRIYTVYADAYDNLGQLLESQGRDADADAVYQESVCFYFL